MQRGEAIQVSCAVAACESRARNDHAPVADYGLWAAVSVRLESAVPSKSKVPREKCWRGPGIGFSAVVSEEKPSKPSIGERHCHSTAGRLRPASFAEASSRCCHLARLWVEMGHGQVSQRHVQHLRSTAGCLSSFGFRGQPSRFSSNGLFMRHSPSRAELYCQHPRLQS